MKIVIFGLGGYYNLYKDIVLKKSSIVALADNDIIKQGTLVDGFKVIAPDTIPFLEFDYVVIMIGYTSFDVRKQLLSLGIEETKILYYDEYISNICQGKRYIYKARKTRIAVVTTELKYNGGIVAVINAARSLLRIGYEITIVSPYANKKLVEEITNLGITVIIYPSFLNMGKKEFFWIKKFDFVIVNTFVSIDCAVKISKIMPMLWWIHDPSAKYSPIYSNTLKHYPLYLNEEIIKNIPIYVVSNVAKNAFHEYYPHIFPKLLPYCVQDDFYGEFEDVYIKTGEKKITFALIGVFDKLKQQNLFVEVAEKINKLYADRTSFFLIGKIGDNEYGRDVISHAEKLNNVYVKGVLTREQMTEVYRKEIDVVVCPSLEDCLPIVITEGMMHSKLCIVSDNTGSADLIMDGKNGFICKTGSVESLYEKMQYCIEHFNELDNVRRAARKTFEDNFTMDIFERRIKNIINEITVSAHFDTSR